VLKAQDLVLKAISPGIRIKFEPGIDIDVHNPEPGEDRALAKIRISDPDPDKKGAELSRICDQLKKKTRGVAAIYPYKVSKDTPAAFVYDVIIDLSASPVFHETVMSADAGKLKVRSSSKKTPINPPAPEIPRDDFDNAKAAVDMLETVDARMFRKALDELGLARTSTLRLVLSRLQRSAIEPEELRAAAKAESEKLTGPADLEELKRISTMESDEFLRPLIDLLFEQTA
jgi:hypothetical protein